MTAPPFPQQQAQQNYFSRAHSNNRLPDPIELANRLEEARTSAKLLEQVVACTPPSEVLGNELIREFADRCLSASRSIQLYMAAQDPSPDNDTLESLIDTNEQLQQALNHHQRAMLNARKQLGLNEPTNSSTPSLNLPPMNDQTRSGGEPAGSSSRSNLPLPPLPSRKDNGKGKAAEVWDAPGPSGSRSVTPLTHGDDEDGQDPFRDPQPEAMGSSSGKQAAGKSTESGDEPPRLAYEPFHPGGFSSGGVSGSRAGGSADTGKQRAPPEPVTPISDDDGPDGSEDRYNATPDKSSTVYRY
jgi:hypothetical protein